MARRLLLSNNHPIQRFLAFNQIAKKDFASRLKISVSHLNFIISGRRRPSFELTRRIVQAAEGQITPEELLFPKGESVSEY